MKGINSRVHDQLSEDGNGVIYTHWQQGIYRFDISQHTWLPANKGIIHTSVSLLKSPGTPLYAFTDKLLHRSDDGGSSWQLVFGSDIPGLYAAATGEVFAAHGLGLMKSTDGFNFETVTASIGKTVTGVTMDEAGSLFIGISQNGVYKGEDHLSSRNANVPALLSLYPNPVINGQLRISTSQPISGNYRIYNITGTLLQENPVPPTGQIDVSGLKAGMYFITINGESRKFVK